MELSLKKVQMVLVSMLLRISNLAVELESVFLVKKLTTFCFVLLFRLFCFLFSLQVIMEIPLELMITIRQKHPWMFFPDIVPIGHPIFDIINSTDPEVVTHLCYFYIINSKVLIFLKVLSHLCLQIDWDIRLACLLLFSFDRDDHFWRLYGDFLPAADECSSLLLATEVD